MRAFCLRSIVEMTLVFLAASSFQICADENKVETTLFELARQADQPGFHDPLYRTPASAAKHHLGYHANADMKLTYQDKTGKLVDYVVHHLLVISWFTKDSIRVLRYTVTPGGQCEDVRHVFNWAEQNRHTHSLTKENLMTLKELLGGLPQSKTVPAIGRTVHVSFLDGVCWRTETYDSTALPEKFEQILVILGEREETKNRRSKDATQGGGAK